uniref:Uncharacterized protein n=1 Tax=Aegilops tauschii subsp. strangulata TaxID=200361 RepID=A0A453HVP3_AEGTS
PSHKSLSPPSIPFAPRRRNPRLLILRTPPSQAKPRPSVFAASSDGPLLCLFLTPLKRRPDAIPSLAVIKP